MKFIFVVAALLSISSAFANARADVSLRNGNFFMTFKDISYPGGMEPKIERVYNSKSDFVGMFGYGWGTEYETKLQVEPDGSLLVTEYGGGAENRFVSKDYKVASVKQGVEAIIQGARKGGLVTSAKQVEAYRNKLMNDSDYRSRQNILLISKGLVAVKKIPDGTQLTSTRFFYEYITKVKGGYVRIVANGNIQKYDDLGHLVQLQDRNKNFINFGYNANGKMISLIDNQNRKMQFTYNQHGFLEKVVGESGKGASFKYSKDGMLEYCKDDEGIENTFKYSGAPYNNLVEVTYLSDKDSKGKPKTLKIEYYGADKFLSVKSVTNLDGTKNEYDYKKDAAKPGYYGVSILIKNAAGAKISNAKYEYYSKLKPNGDLFTTKMVEDVDGDKKETIYDETLGFPVKITSNGRTTSMQYDSKGRMVKKVTPIETTELAYSPTVGKVTKVVRKLRSGTILWSTFEYDPKTTNLTAAKNSDKKQVKLIYDQNGRIRALVDQTGRQLTFKYNELSKPIEIADAKLGTIKITYKNSGEVDKMDSNGGASAAAEVLQALQNLIDITAPAGVTMSL